MEKMILENDAVQYGELRICIGKSAGTVKHRATDGRILAWRDASLDADVMTDSPPSQTRRDLLSALNPSRYAEKMATGETPAVRIQPSAGVTVRLTTRAMACDFSVIMNPGPTEQIEAAGLALDAIHQIESWLSIYRADSDLSKVNRSAFTESQSIRGDLFELLEMAAQIHQKTDGAFDMATGSLTALWRSCRKNSEIPTQEKVEQALEIAGMQHVALFRETNSVRIAAEGLILDPGAIGKGFALDDASRWLQQADDGPSSFLLHGGHSSLKACGGHNGHIGWPVGIGNPLFTEKRLGTLLLCDQAMATSGSNIQFFRYEGRRYGHILDPRTGWPVEGMLSVTVLAPSAAVADALSTAFFVMGVEKARQCCENWPEVGVILIPFPDQGRKVQPVVIGIPQDLIVWDEDQVIV